MDFLTKQEVALLVSVSITLISVAIYITINITIINNTELGKGAIDAITKPYTDIIVDLKMQLKKSTSPFEKLQLTSLLKRPKILRKLEEVLLNLKLNLHSQKI